MLRHYDTGETRTNESANETKHEVRTTTSELLRSPIKQPINQSNQKEAKERLFRFQNVCSSVDNFANKKKIKKMYLKVSRLPFWFERVIQPSEDFVYSGSLLKKLKWQADRKSNSQQLADDFSDFYDISIAFFSKAFTTF